MTLPTPQPPSPGWYDDPEAQGQLRYFDGILWTSHTTRRDPAPAPRPSVAEPAPPPAVGAPPSAQAPIPAASRPLPGVTGPTLEDGTVLASVGQRIGAFLLDGLIKLALALVFGGWAAYLSVRDQVSAAMAAAREGRIEPFNLAAADQRWLMVYLLIISLIGLLYSVVFLTRRGATPGKAAVGISVRRVDRPGPIDVPTAVKRYAIPFATSAASAVPFLGSALSGLWLADHAMPILHPQRRALHDLMAGTVVVVGRQPPHTSPQPPR